MAASLLDSGRRCQAPTANPCKSDMAFGNPSWDRPPLSPRALRCLRARDGRALGLRWRGTDVQPVGRGGDAGGRVGRRAECRRAGGDVSRRRRRPDCRSALLQGAAECRSHIGDLRSATGEQSRVGDLRRQDAGRLAAGRSGRAGGDHGGRPSVASYHAPSGFYSVDQATISDDLVALFEMTVVADERWRS